MTGAGSAGRVGVLALVGTGGAASCGILGSLTTGAGGLTGRGRVSPFSAGAGAGDGGDADGGAASSPEAVGVLEPFITGTDC